MLTQHKPSGAWCFEQEVWLGGLAASTGVEELRF